MLKIQLNLGAHALELQMSQVSLALSVPLLEGIGTLDRPLSLFYLFIMEKRSCESDDQAGGLARVHRNHQMVSNSVISRGRPRRKAKVIPALLFNFIRTYCLCYCCYYWWGSTFGRDRLLAKFAWSYRWLAFSQSAAGGEFLPVK